MTPNNTLQGTRFSGRHGFRYRAVRALERERRALLGTNALLSIRTFPMFRFERRV